MLRGHPKQGMTKLGSYEERMIGVDGRFFCSALPHFCSSELRELYAASNRKKSGRIRRSSRVDRIVRTIGNRKVDYHELLLRRVFMHSFAIFSDDVVLNTENADEPLEYAKEFNNLMHTLPSIESQFKRKMITTRGTMETPKQRSLVRKFASIVLAIIGIMLFGSGTVNLMAYGEIFDIKNYLALGILFVGSFCAAYFSYKNWNK